MIRKLLLTVILMLAGVIQAFAIIDKIEVAQFDPGFKIYQPNDTVPVPQGRDRFFRVSGGGTDLATKIEVSGSGIPDCPIAGKKRGVGSYIEFRCTVDDDAPSNVRTVSIKYPLGEDTFRIEVFKVGTISKIEYEPDLSAANTSFSSIGSNTTGRQPATNLPRNKELTLVVTGTKLSNVVLYLRRDPYATGEVLPGATDTECKIRIKFTSGITHRILLVDGEATDKIVPIEFFHYKGSPTSSKLDVTTQTPTTSSSTGTTTSSGSSTVTTIDWVTSAVPKRGQNFSRFRYECPAGGPISERVWGTDLYTDDTAICSAAVHAGVITLSGGIVTIEIRPGAPSYQGTPRNGVISQSFGAWHGSFVFK